MNMIMMKLMMLVLTHEKRTNIWGNPLYGRHHVACVTGIVYFTLTSIL